MLNLKTDDSHYFKANNAPYIKLANSIYVPIKLYLQKCFNIAALLRDKRSKILQQAAKIPFKGICTRDRYNNSKIFL